MVKFQHAQRRVLHSSRPVWQPSHILLFPPLAKLRAEPLQVFDDYMKRGITRIARVIRAELRHQVACLLLPVEVERVRLTPKEAPDDIARVRRAGLIDCMICLLAY